MRELYLPIYSRGFILYLCGGDGWCYGGVGGHGSGVGVGTPAHLYPFDSVFALLFMSWMEGLIGKIATTNQIVRLHPIVFCLI